MASEWPTYTVQEMISMGILDPPLDGNHGEIHPKTSDFVSEGIPFIMASDLANGLVDIVNCSFISETQARRLRKGFAINNDVLLSHKATIGRTALVQNITTDFIVLTPQVTYYRIRDYDKLDNRYLKYYFDSVKFQELLSTWAGAGSTRAYLGITAQRKLPILCPPIEQQRAIAQILGNLDDKIELNRRMNATLEAMARAIFKSWFVDFEPVRAKAEGREPENLAPEIAALFPDRFEDSELGEIPASWKVGHLEDMLVLQRGFDLPNTQRLPGPYPVMAASGCNGSHNAFMVKGPGVTTGRSGVLGKVFYVHGDFWPLNTSLWVKEFKHCTPTYALHLLRGLDFETFNAGSAVPTLNRNHVHNLPIVLPPLKVIGAFESMVALFLQKQQSNDSESRALATLRDTLLPKLLSGELRMKDAEYSIERTV